jgi:hypothetical protein
MSQTARLLERLDYAASETSSPKASAPIGSETFSAHEKVELSEFKPRHAPGFDAASRMAGRINASAISKAEQDAFLAERAALLKKKYESGLAGREANRLEYVRWSLDRIEDAKYGGDLDVLDSAVSQYEDFLGETKTLRESIAGLGKKSV